MGDAGMRRSLVSRDVSLVSNHPSVEHVTEAVMAGLKMSSAQALSRQQLVSRVCITWVRRQSNVMGIPVGSRKVAVQDGC